MERSLNTHHIICHKILFLRLGRGKTYVHLQAGAGEADDGRILARYVSGNWKKKVTFLYVRASFIFKARALHRQQGHNHTTIFLSFSQFGVPFESVLQSRPPLQKVQNREGKKEIGFLSLLCLFNVIGSNLSHTVTHNFFSFFFGAAYVRTSVHTARKVDEIS